MNKLKLWQEHSEWDIAEKIWDEGAFDCATKHPIKQLKTLPSMPGITEETARFLKWKSIKWTFLKDADGEIRRRLLKNPFRYAWKFIKSAFKKKSYQRDGDFFYYGIQSEEEFCQLLKNEQAILVLGFSYCHKPFECPAGRFNDQCIHDADHPVCRQCFIGKAVNAMPENNAIPLFIPTVHYIGSKIFHIMDQFPGRQILFIITACEMTLEMFGDFGNMVGIKGVGVRLDGRICNTMKAFELSEQGIKPGLTVVLDETQKRVLRLLRYRSEASINLNP